MEEAACESLSDFREVMTPEEVAGWLLQHSIPYEFCQTFEANFIDGSEFLQLTLDELKSMCPLGIAKKVYRLIPQEQPCQQPDVVDYVSDNNSLCGGNSESNISTLQSTSLKAQKHSLSPMSPSECSSASLGPSVSAINSECSSVVSTSGSTLQGHVLEIPKMWKPHVNACIEKKKLTDGARNEIVQRLVDILFSKNKKPTRDDCIEIGRKLILTYPFMKDEAGIGPAYTSWVNKMIQRVRNVIKRANKQAQDGDDLPPTKKKKANKTQSLLMRYPAVQNHSIVLDDPQSLEGHLKALRSEMAKGKPRDSIILPLMKSTFSSRREWILESKEMIDVTLQNYPALSLPAVIEQELDLIIGKPTKSQFLHNWSGKYVEAILAYAKKCTKGTVKTLTDDIENIIEPEKEKKEKLCLKIVYECWRPRAQQSSLNFMYEKFEEENRSIEELCKLSPPRNSPRIIEMSDMTETVYYIVCEQTVFCKTFSFSDSLYFCFATYYICNYEYPKQIRNVLCFFQDHVLNYPDCSNRSTNYVTVVTDIKKNITQ